MKSEPLLCILQILEQETDCDHKLTKNNILDILSNRWDVHIDEKQFYRTIDKLIDNGYPIVKTKGRHSWYFMQQNALCKEELLFLRMLILHNEDLSIRETNHIIKCLKRVALLQESKEIVSELQIKATENKSPYNQLPNFSAIIQAKRQGKSIRCVKRISVSASKTSSQQIVLDKVDFYFRNNKVIVVAKEDSKEVEYCLNELIDVKII